MAKRITISVPDKLYEKMQKWKDSFNFSGIFQDAVSKRTAKKEDYENFKQKTKEHFDMSKTIERLRKQKDEAGKSYFEQGQKDGYMYAKSMDYNDFQYALEYETTKEIIDREPNTTGWDPTQDEYFGDYFKDMIEEDELMAFEETAPSYYIPNEYFIEWEDGFIRGINEFWNEIKDKL